MYCGPREDLWLCLLEFMWTDSVIFERGSNEGILGMANRIPEGSPGAKHLGDPGYFVPQKLKQNVTVMLTFSV